MDYFELEVVADQTFRIAEAPRWNHETGLLWFIDLAAGELYRFDPKTKKITLLADGKNFGGIAFNRSGGIVASTQQGIYLWNENDGFTLIADEYLGEKLVCNDGIADAAGRFLFGTTYYLDLEADENTKRGKLYSMDTNGHLRVLDEGILLTNGLGFSPDNKTFYYTDTADRTIYAYHYDLASGDLSDKRIFVKLRDTEGIPDGLTVDAEGYVWSATWYGGCVNRFAPDGTLDYALRTPGYETSAVAFGGKDFRDLYVTTASQWNIHTCIPRGFAPVTEFLHPGGHVYCYHFNCHKGLPCNFADIRLD